jgi:hypothetical protein
MTLSTRAYVVAVIPLTDNTAVELKFTVPSLFIMKLAESVLSLNSCPFADPYKVFPSVVK